LESRPHEGLKVWSIPSVWGSDPVSGKDSARSLNTWQAGANEQRGQLRAVHLQRAYSWNFERCRCGVSAGWRKELCTVAL
jgi:hypothetical protein